ncbi:hypothetical protein NDU88_001495 [Pleurodeles waltl]|uniref:Uncharacterized protein n=1 Tax=Pleurodeles waltl TaxID=8319 RepID=A0AAV7P6V1_PLEWA|nr:hypothetical protein NDU88_001495 [Pleurodeles waltl]
MGIAARRSSRLRRASRRSRVIVRSDGTLSLERKRQEREEAKLLVRFLSDHAPLLLECETHVPKPAIPLWRLRPDLLSDPEYKQDLQGALNGYFSNYWGTAATRGVKTEALKVVIRGESLSKMYRIRRRLDQELTLQEDVLTALQQQIDNGDASESVRLGLWGRIIELWDSLDSCARQSYRQWLYREGDRLGSILAWIPSGELILGQLQVNSHLREHLWAIYTAPWGVDVTRIGEYLDGLRLPRLTGTQSEELEGEVSLDDMMEAL